MSAADKIAEAPVFCEDEAAKAETNCRCDILHPSDHQERHTSPAGHIAEARALIEPLTGHDDGPWATAHRGTRTDFRKGRDYHRVTTLRDAVDPDAEAVAHVAWRPRREANARLIAAAPALRDTVAALADLADAQAQEIAELRRMLKSTVCYGCNRRIGDKQWLGFICVSCKSKREFLSRAALGETP